MKKKDNALRNLLITIVILAVVMFGVTTCFRHVKKIGLRMVCGTNMLRFGDCLGRYASENQGEYPPPDKWCDIVFEKIGMSYEHYLCKVDSNGLYYYSNSPDESNLSLEFSHISSDVNEPKYIYKIKTLYYAMNPNASPKSPNDVVLLFESKPGWNQYGGAELMRFGHHQPEVCNVLFNDGSVRFVNPEEAKNLNWGKSD